MLGSRLAWWSAWLSVTALGATAFAHAVVTKTSLDGGPMRAGAATSVTLQLNSAVEAAFTRVTLVDAAGATTPLEAGAGTKPGEVVIQVPALEAGRYGLRYRVLAIDGHVTESVLRFRVER